MPARKILISATRVKYHELTSKDLQVINGVLIYIEDDKTEQYALPPIEIHISEDAAWQMILRGHRLKES